MNAYLLMQSWQELYPFFFFFCYVEMNLYFLWKQISSEWRCWVSTFPCLCGNGFPRSMEAALHEQPLIGNSLPIYREKSVQTFCFLCGMWCCPKWQNNLRFSEGNQKIFIHGTKQLKSIKSTFFPCFVTEPNSLKMLSEALCQIIEA